MGTFEQLVTPFKDFEGALYLVVVVVIVAVLGVIIVVVVTGIILQHEALLSQHVSPPLGSTFIDLFVLLAFILL